MKFDKKIYRAICENRNHEVFSRLYKESYPKIRSYITRNDGSEEDAKDIFQETVIILMRAVLKNKIEYGKELQPYIYVVARNLWVDKKRKEKRIAKLDEQRETEDEYMTEITEHIELREREADLEGLLKKLGEKCFQILKEVIDGNTDYSDIAELIGVSNSNVVKVYKNRCKQKMIQLLQSHESYRNMLIKYERRFEKYI